MVKLVVIAKRKPGMTHEAFSRYWLMTHAPLGKKVPGLRRYVVNIAQPGKEAPPVGGLAELWFDNAEALKAGMSSPEGKAAAADLQNFADMGSLVSFPADEYTISWSPSRRGEA